jgi:hypothetical protein
VKFSALRTQGSWISLLIVSGLNMSMTRDSVTRRTARAEYSVATWAKRR